MFSFDQAFSEFDRYALARDPPFFRRLGSTHASPSRTFTETSAGVTRTHLLGKLGRPPRPSNNKPTQHSSAGLANSFSTDRSRPLGCFRIGDAENDKENERPQNTSGVLQWSPTNVRSPRPRKHRFVIKKASPVAQNKDDRPAEQAFRRQGSVKFRSLVDRSRSITRDNQVAGLLQDLPRVSSRSWVALDCRSREALFGYKYGVKREVASLTKLMTLFTACRLADEERLDMRGFEVTVSARAASMIGTSANLRAGDRLSLHDLLFGRPVSPSHHAAVGQRRGAGHLRLAGSAVLPAPQGDRAGPLQAAVGQELQQLRQVLHRRDEQERAAAGSVVDVLRQRARAGQQGQPVVGAGRGGGGRRRPGAVRRFQGGRHGEVGRADAGNTGPASCGKARRCRRSGRTRT